MHRRSYSEQPEREARARLVDTLERLGIERSLAEQVPSISWQAERARKTAWTGVLQRLGFDPSELERWGRSEQEAEDYYRTRDAARAALSNSPKKQDAIGALTYLLVHAAPSGDSSEVRRALVEIDLAWPKQPGCLEWLPMIAAVATGAPDGDVRMRAIKLLGEIGDSAAGEALLAALEGDDDMSVRVAAAYGLIGIAETLQESPRARAILEEATDPKYLDPAANLVRHAAEVLKRLGVVASTPVLEVDWESAVDDQVSPSDVRAILDLALNVRAGLVLRFYAAHVQQPAARVIGPLLALFETDAQVAVIHGAGKGHLFAQAESLYTLAREVPSIGSYRELVNELRKRGFKVGYAPSISL